LKLTTTTLRFMLRSPLSYSIVFCSKKA